MEPQTWSGKAKDRLEGLLKDAATARTSSITLANMEYAGELSAQLLDHAVKLEQAYKDIQKALASSATSEEDFKNLNATAFDLDRYGEKMQAWCLFNKYVRV